MHASDEIFCACAAEHYRMYEDPACLLLLHITTCHSQPKFYSQFSNIKMVTWCLAWCCITLEFLLALEWEWIISMFSFFFHCSVSCIVGDVVFTIPYMCTHSSQVNTSCLFKTPLCQVVPILISWTQAKLQLHKTSSIPLTFSCCHLSQFTPSTYIYP